MDDKKGEVTQLLLAWRRGEASALGRLMPLVLDELRHIARGYMAGERPDHTLLPTALINELYLKLVDVRRVTWRDRAHFLGTTATMCAGYPRLPHGQVRATPPPWHIELDFGSYEFYAPPGRERQAPPASTVKTTRGVCFRL